MGTSAGQQGHSINRDRESGREGGVACLRLPEDMSSVARAEEAGVRSRELLRLDAPRMHGEKVYGTEVESNLFDLNLHVP
eukprot:scaffold20497_cov69-Phaeocystis_antarctica.AAC.6